MFGHTDTTTITMKKEEKLNGILLPNSVNQLKIWSQFFFFLFFILFIFIILTHLVIPTI